MKFEKKMILLVMLANLSAPAHSQATAMSSGSTKSTSTVAGAATGLTVEQARAIRASKYTCTDVPVTDSIVQLAYVNYISWFLDTLDEIQTKNRAAPKGKEPFVKDIYFSDRIGIRREDYQLIKFYTLKTVDDLNLNHHAADVLRQQHVEQIQPDGIVVPVNRPPSSNPSREIEQNLMEEVAIRAKLKTDLKRELGDKVFVQFDRFVKARVGIQFKPVTDEEFLEQCVARKDATEPSRNSGGSK